MSRWSRSFASAGAVLGIMAAVVLAPSSPAEAASAPASAFTSLAPTRVLDTRTGLGGHLGRPAAGTTLDLTVTGGAVPADATAVVMNVVATDAAQTGYVQLLPTGQGALGASSNLNVGPGGTVANLVTVPVGSAGRVTLYDVAGAHLVADVQGYFRPAVSSAAREVPCPDADPPGGLAEPARHGPRGRVAGHAACAHPVGSSTVQPGGHQELW